MDYKKILLTIGGIGLTFILLLGAYYVTSKPQQSSFPQLKEIKSDDHVKWATESAHTLVEYSDFQCPACSSYFGLIESLNTDEDFVSNVKTNIALVYRHFPLDNAHPNARIAAYAAEAAGKQNKFFEMHDLLFTNQSEWSESNKPEETFKKYASELGLNIDQFMTDINSTEVKDKVQRDYRSGLEVDVPGTPSFFLDGRKLQTPNSAEDFKKLLLKGIESSGK